MVKRVLRRDWSESQTRDCGKILRCEIEAGEVAEPVALPGSEEIVA
jgi:hypothetical protein